MSGCFGNTHYDRHLERELNDHLEWEEWNNEKEEEQKEEIQNDELN